MWSSLNPFFDFVGYQPGEAVNQLQEQAPQGACWVGIENFEASTPNERLISMATSGDELRSNGPVSAKEVFYALSSQSFHSNREW
jgi:hypothetical protein